MTPHITLCYGETPPSLNLMGTRGSHWIVRREKQKWQGIFDGLLMEAKIPKHLNAIYATAELTFPTRRRRDEGNFRWMLEKALGDSLVVGGYLLDDDPDHFRFGKLTFDPTPGKPELIVRLECL